MYKGKVVHPLRYPSGCYETPDWRQWNLAGVFSVNFEQVLHIFLVFALFTSNE